MVCGALWACAAVWPTAAAAAPAALRFSSLPENVDSSEIQVFGGMAPISGDWDSILVAKMPASSGLRSCTATLVGMDVLLTAAHCVDANDTQLRDVVLEINTHEVTFRCKVDDRYLDRTYKTKWPRGPEDWALCARVIADVNPNPPPARYLALRRETIDLSPLPGNTRVLITGYGCVDMHVDLKKPELVFGAFQEVFNIGDETVAAPATSNPWLTTVSDQGREPALCQGDSGGPLFTGASTAEPLKPRWVRAVNSQVSVATLELVSSYSALSHPTFLKFLACWRKDNAAYAIKVKDASLVPACPA